MIPFPSLNMRRVTLRTVYHIFFFSALLILLFSIASQKAVASEGNTLDWTRVADRKPDQKVLVLVEAEVAIGLKDLAALAELGMVPADNDPGRVLGLQRAIFSTRLKKWITRRALPAHLKGRLLDRFILSGIYRTGFRVEKDGYSGPLSLEVTAPREGFGKQLIYSESLVQPRGLDKLRVDLAGNRWFCVDYPEVKYGQVIKFFFAFKYRVHMAALLDHDLIFTDQAEKSHLPEEVLPFLKPGYKIDPRLPQAMAWAKQGKEEASDIRLEYRRLTKYLKDTIAYDRRKRDQYFEGRKIYSDLDEMYQDVSVTLTRRMGACPDTVLLECAFLRARDIPCRTAGRFGHFYSLVYVPNRGWMSTSVTPTGIPLIVDPGPDHLPFQRWSPTIPLKMILWEAPFRVEALEE